MKKLLFVLALLVALPASAAFTPAEIVELRKIYTARSEQSAALVVLADVYRDTTNDTRKPAIAAALVAGSDAEFECHQAMRHLLNVGPNLFPAFGVQTRAQLVAKGINYALSCDAKTADFANKLRAVGAFTTGNRLDTNVNLETFQSLAFTEWQPAGYPRVVGPHGDYDKAANALAVADHRFLRAYRAVHTMYQKEPRWPASAADTGVIFGHREMARYGADYSKFIAAALFVEAGVESAGDTAAIDSDFAAGSGVRTREFFVPLHVFDINSNPDAFGTNVNFHGRALGSGANGQLEVVLDGLGRMAAGFISYQRSLASAGTITHQQAVDRIFNSIALGGGAQEYQNISFMGGGFLTQANGDISHAWEASQAYDFFAFEFLSALPLPPPGGSTPPPCPECPPVVTCGAGTHLEGAACVADPLPTCDFDLEVVAIDEDRAEVRCVQR